MSENVFSVKDKVVVITGGLGQLGRAYARSLAEAGAKVAVFDLQAEGADLPEPLDSLAREKRLLAVDCDVTDKDSVEKALARVESVFGSPHGLVNNAALDSPPDSPDRDNGPFEDYPEESWKQVMDVNVNGVFFCCQVVGGRMAEAGRGSIINVSSIYGVVSPDQNLYEYRREKGEIFYKPAAYSVSKSALINLTRYLATYWAPKGVRVNTLVLGGVFNNQDDKFFSEYARRAPMGRMADENEYSGAVQFLLSDASSYMTGSQMVLDGGWTAW
ncbi:MAG: SDR family oxidoreductase [Thermodesulfobacteriota bacterium]|nr:SDR family oxidoreductase [Thermodesulfobacteriota bacterium]